MDISPTIQPNSQQVNADDLVTPITVTITNVEAGTSEQPVFIHLAEFPARTYRPGKSMRRVLVHAWGAEASAYIGRRLTLYNDETIRFGRDVTGGIRISHMSHIENTLTVALTVTRGKRAPFIVEPLTAAPVDGVLADEWLETINAAETMRQLEAAWGGASRAGVTKDQRLVDAKDAKKTALATADR